MSHRPLVSICIPVYNGEKHVREAIQSAITQSYDNIEVVVVDNASSDSTPNIIQEIASRMPCRFRCFRNDRTISMVENFNFAISMAAGDYIKILPHDDILPEDSVRTMMDEALKDQQFLVGYRDFIFESASFFQRIFYLSQKLFWRPKRKFNSLLVSPETYLKTVSANPCHNFLGEPGSILFHIDAFRQVGGFDPEYLQLCDLNLWHKLGVKYGLQIIPARAAHFRVHDQSQSKQSKREGIYQALKECLLLSSLIMRSCNEGPASDASRRQAALNHQLDVARYAIYGEEKYTNEQVDRRVSNLSDKLIKLVVRLPVKRIYQLFMLKCFYGFSPVPTKKRC